MNQEYSSMAYQHKIQMLQDKNNQLVTQNNLIKETNEALLAQLAATQPIRTQNYKLSLQIQQLQERLHLESKTKEDNQNDLNSIIKHLKQEMRGRDIAIQRLQIQHDAQIFRLKSQVDRLKSQFRQKQKSSNDEFDRSLVSSYLMEFRPSEQNSFDYSNRISNVQERTVNKSTLSKSNWPRQQSFKTGGGQQDYSKYSKVELKSALKSLSQAGKKLREGSQQVSVLHQRRSLAFKNGI